MPPSAVRSSASMPRASIECAGAAVLPQLLLEHMRGLGEGRVDVAELDLVGGDDVGGELAADRRCARFAALPHVGDERQELVVDRDQRGGVLGDVAVVREHHRHRLADIAHLAVGERRTPQALSSGMPELECRTMRRFAMTVARSSSVSTACTPGTASAAILSMPLIARADAGCARRPRAKPGSAMSSTKRPRPRSSGSSSRRVMREPMVGIESMPEN